MSTDLKILENIRQKNSYINEFYLPDLSDDEYKFLLEKDKNQDKHSRNFNNWLPERKEWRKEILLKREQKELEKEITQVKVSTKKRI